ncbi:MAG TPA: hypothetical protein VEB21_10080 [Terriglobales bacterium]|nr:hypothetical protein [Terriglobales bacterium]
MDDIDFVDRTRLRSVAMVALFVSGCATIGADAPARVSHPMLSCAAATRAARGTIQRMGYGGGHVPGSGYASTALVAASSSSSMVTTALPLLSRRHGAATQSAYRVAAARRAMPAAVVI